MSHPVAERRRGFCLSRRGYVVGDSRVRTIRRQMTESAAVRTGPFGMKLSFVPIQNAEPSGGNVRVRFDNDHLWHRRLGPVADQVKERAKDTGAEVLERAKQVADEAAQSAEHTAQESGRQQAEELRSRAEDSMRRNPGASRRDAEAPGHLRRGGRP
jgi:hypothetical protein